jgi:hypothetical protein
MVFAMLSGSGKKVMVRKEIRDQANPIDNSQSPKPILRNYRTVFSSFIPSARTQQGSIIGEDDGQKCTAEFRTIGRVLWIAVERELSTQSFRRNTE